MKAGPATPVAESRRRHVAPREPLPAAKPFGALVAAAGILLLVVACGSTELPWYWQANAPALWGMSAGALIAGGLLICYLRFTLRFFLVTVAIVGLSGTLSQVVSQFSNRVSLEYQFPPEAMMRLFEQGLVGSLEQDRAIPSFPSPLAIDTTYARWQMHFRPHVDARVAGLSVAVQELCDAIYYPDSVRYRLYSVVDGYVEAVQERFGTEAARHVAERSAELAPTEDMQGCFRAAASRLAKASQTKQ